MLKPRWLARLVAAVRLSWWAPCPICRENCAAFEQASDVPGTYVPAEMYGDSDVHSYACRKPICIRTAQRAHRNRMLREMGPSMSPAQFDEIMRTGGGYCL
jgi:hypothetical protein